MTNTAPTELTQKAAGATETARLAISEATTTVGSTHTKDLFSKLPKGISEVFENLGNMMRLMA